MARSQGVTKNLLETLLKDQARRAERERKLPYAQKLRILDEMIAEWRRAEGFNDPPG